MAREIIKDRICSHCGGNEYYTSLRKKKKKDGSITIKKTYICVKKSAEWAKYYYKNGHRSYLKNTKEYYENNKEHFAESAKKYRKTKRGKEALERARKKERDNLTDNYIRQCLYSYYYNNMNIKIVRSEIPQDMIEDYRKIQIAKRKLKMLKNENKKTNQKDQKEYI